MTGAQLLTYLKRRLAIEALTDDELDDPELYDYLTEARDEVMAALTMAAPMVVSQIITFVVDPANAHLYALPDLTRDPYRILEVRAIDTQAPLVPSAKLGHDAGHYRWRSIRQLELADGVSPPGGVEADCIIQGGIIDAAATEPGIGLPIPCHRAIGKYAAVLALTVNEESDATAATGLYQRELERLERIYGEFDGRGGEALRQAFLESYGTQHGDSLY